ncbi:MAG TPA: hypothetical protein VK843_03130 [Planctomycetota bacterium]|nr:hypothetical protein [Planctomycetota bacterium]
MSKYLTESGWKAVVAKSKVKIADNGLAAVLKTYEARPEEKYTERMADLKKVFTIGLGLNNTNKKIGDAAAAEFLSKMCAESVKTQEELQADKIAAATDKNDKIMLQNMVIQAATNVTINGKANAAFFGRQVVAACTAFQVHSKSKLDDLKGELTAGDLLGPLIMVVSGGIVGGLMAGVADPIAKRVVSEMQKLAEGQLKKRAQSIGDSSKDLEKAVQALIQGATDAATAMESVVTKLIMPECKKVIDGVNSGKRLSPELTAFIEPFIRANPTEMDKLLEARFGLPSAAKSKQVQVKIYQDMVQRFEREVIKAATPSSEKLEWVITGVPDSVGRKAEQRAKQAGQQREKDIRQKEVEMGL